MTVEIRKRQVGVTDRWIIEAVDGKQVRNELDIDFALAGNPAVKKYIPPDQLWVEMMSDKTEWPCFIVHEDWEDGRVEQGMPYEVAHEEANVLERLCRQGKMELTVFRPG
jgi:hypothetical protein